MRFLFALAVLACAAVGVYASNPLPELSQSSLQTVAYSKPADSQVETFPYQWQPLTELSLTGVVDSKTKASLLGTAAVTSPLITPDFTLWLRHSERYSVEIKYASPVDLTFQFAFDTAFTNAPIQGASPELRAVTRAGSSIVYADFNTFVHNFTGTPDQFALPQWQDILATYTYNPVNYGVSASTGADANGCFGVGGSHGPFSVTFSHVNGITYLEWNVFEFYTFSWYNYVVLVNVHSADGYQLLTLETESVASNFVGATGLYQLAGSPSYEIIFYTSRETLTGPIPDKDYTFVSGTTTIPTTYQNFMFEVPFYLSAHVAVDGIVVQECPGRVCGDCSVPVLDSSNVPVNPRRPITTGIQLWGTTQGGICSNAPCWPLLGYVDNRSSFGATGVIPSAATSSLPSGSLQPSDVPQSGRYVYIAYTGLFTGTAGAIGVNCVRFISHITQPATAGGSNENTITIFLQVKNCYEYGSCTPCAGDPFCGWCIHNDGNKYQYQDGDCEMSDWILTFDPENPLNPPTNPGQAYSQATPSSPYICTAPGYPSVSSAPATGFFPRFINFENAWSKPVSQGGEPAYGCQAAILGDPRISGLQGQDFQVHGTPNEYFNLVSSATVQVNSRFVYLDEAKCDNFTDCFTHPGTYIDEIGVMMGDNKVRIVAGSIEEGSRVFINGKEITPSNHKHVSGQVSVKFYNNRRVTVRTPVYMFTASQSDRFFNIDSALLQTELLDQGSKLVKESGSRATEANTVLHGLIGQTWRNTIYAGDREYEGEVPDYQVADGLWGSDFHFNLYQN